MNRRDFVRVIGQAVATGFVVGACSGSGSGSGSDPGAENAGGPDASIALACASTQISANHGHSIAIPSLDIDAGTEQSYNIQGGSGHPHTITLTTGDFSKLQAGETITLTSTIDAGHTHSVTVTCA